MAVTLRLLQILIQTIEYRYTQRVQRATWLYLVDFAS
jgi:hypothetical protein